MEKNANPIIASVYDDYFKSLLNGDKNQCSLILDKIIEQKTEIKTVYDELFTPTLYKIGELWEFNRISVAVEHLATSITETLMNKLYPIIFRTEHLNKSAVVSCIANEFHQIGGKMVADMFELNHWNGYFLGANTPINDLLSFINEKKPEILCLTLSVTFNFKNLINTIDAVKNCFSDINIIVGGYAFKMCDLNIGSRYSNTDYIENLDTLEKKLFA